MAAYALAHLHNPNINEQVLEYIDRIKSGEFGDVHALRVYWNGGGVWDPRKTREECGSDMEYQMRNWYYYCWLSGDHIVEQAVHGIDTMAGFRSGNSGAGK